MSGCSEYFWNDGTLTTFEYIPNNQTVRIYFYDDGNEGCHNPLAIGDPEIPLNTCLELSKFNPSKTRIDTYYISLNVSFSDLLYPNEINETWVVTDFFMDNNCQNPGYPSTIGGVCDFNQIVCSSDWIYFIYENRTALIDRFQYEGKCRLESTFNQTKIVGVDIWNIFVPYQSLIITCQIQEIINQQFINIIENQIIDQPGIISYDYIQFYRSFNPNCTTSYSILLEGMNICLRDKLNDDPRNLVWNGFSIETSDFIRVMFSEDNCNGNIDFFLIVSVEVDEYYFHDMCMTSATTFNLENSGIQRYEKMFLSNDPYYPNRAADVFIFGLDCDQDIEYYIFFAQENYDLFEKELKIMANLAHPGVIRFFGASLKPPRVGIVMEYCSNGEILDFFIRYQKEHSETYTIYEKLRMCREIISVCEYIHSKNVIHRDIKSENILIDSSEHCKLMDFGISRIVEDYDSKKLTRQVGTRIYMAPEILTGKYDHKCDVFSFGILLYVILSESQPYQSKFRGEYIVAQDHNYRPSIQYLKEQSPFRKQNQNGKFDWLIDNMVRCWKHESVERNDFKELNKLFELKNKENVIKETLCNEMEELQDGD